MTARVDERLIVFTDVTGQERFDFDLRTRASWRDLTISTAVPAGDYNVRTGRHTRFRS